MRALWQRSSIALRVQFRLVQRHLKRIGGAASFAGLLASVGLVLLLPLLLDDFVFLRSNLFRPSEDTLTIFRPVLLSDNPRVMLSQGALSMPPNLSGKARTGEALAALVQGGSARLALESPVFTIELASNRPGTGEPTPMDGVSPSFAVAQSPLLNALDSGAFEALSIRHGTINVKTLTGRIETLTNVSADVTVKRKSSIRSKGTFNLRGEEFAFDTTLGNRIERRDAARIPMKAHIHNRLIDATIEGRLDLTGTLELVAQTADIKLSNIRSVGRWLGQVWPSGPGLKDVHVRGSMDWRADTITLQKGDISIDGNQATGSLAFRFGAGRPLLVGTLAFDSFSLSPYLHQPLTAEPDERGLFTVMKSQRDFAMPLLDQIDADLRFSLNVLRAGPWQVGRAAAGLTIKNGQGILDIAEILLDGQSRLSALIQVGASPTVPTYLVTGKVEDLDMGPFTTAVVGMPTLSGRGGLMFNLRANGISGLDILSRTSGRIAVDLPQGGTVACTIKNLTEVAQAKVAILGGACRSVTALSTLSGAVQVTDGVASAEKVSATTSTENLRMDGLIDLVSSLLDVTVVTTPLAPSRTDLASQPREILSIRGRLEAPVFAIKGP